MSRKEEFKKLTELENLESVKRPVVLANKQEMVASNDNPYLILTLMDGYSSTEAKMFKTSWPELEGRGFAVGGLAEMSIQRKDYKGRQGYVINSIDHVTDDSLSVGDFIKMPPIDVEVMFEEIVGLIESSKTAPAEDDDTDFAPLGDLAIAILTDLHDDFVRSSAAKSMHHNMKGGLIYHTYRMVKTADAVSRIYTSLDKELLICGTALHDIGKLWEYKTNEVGAADYTVNYALFGHLYLGASLIKKYAMKAHYDNEKVLLLTHMILSHHGTLEFGAVRTPAIPEAFALCYIDNLDAKIDTCDGYLETLAPGEMTDKAPFGLDNRIYKARYKE